MEEEIPDKNDNMVGGFSNGHSAPRSSMHDSHKSQSQNKKILDSRTNFGISNGRNTHDIEMELVNGGSLLRGGISSNDEMLKLTCSPERTSMKKSNKYKSASHSPGTKMYKSPKTTVKSSREQSCSDMDNKGQIADESSKYHGSLLLL